MTNENPATIELGDALVSAEQSKSRRKRLIAQTAAGAMLGAVVITGAFTVLPGLFSQDEAVSAGSGGLAVVPAAAPASSAPAEPAPQRPNQGPGISDKQEKALDKYFASGYDLNEGRKLAKLWKMEDKELIQVKAIAGQKLLDGEKLPVKPGSPPVEQSDAESKQVAKFFEEGYDYDDAAKLAKLWKKPTPYDAKVEGGKRLLAGQTLPVKP
ncbi:hypothetical protein [Actinoplanes sp. NBRC 103695]|uniref:hypothetical protein n=1 Tax=Actinoplanes sp. NBRC 103695 TaxID=3032202 RepID=UPI0024A533B4|nr:hypothetical protein [Actinoplanes sp. NBRC 103695]GLY97626.1 hypothetical protein Acsp02_48800 [Actinoplanes sp. NBRC 103695]